MQQRQVHSTRTCQALVALQVCQPAWQWLSLLIHVSNHS